ncbi:DUF6307 family protein [Actinokineospora terrae]|uniref:Uncharacterized protein n=1 Tax=Actinokineospora terrae TaxID=155974 RepID=A0A1H9X8G1_9PSEU|nr:DUF6307 family protein [Actinokineospora terrae]SES42430.1 hypothetical protein SAMN04487818_113136 [Actinokineospora terrae]
MTEYVSGYDTRVNLVKDVLAQHSKLTDDMSLDLAKRILGALDTIPEKLR